MHGVLIRTAHSRSRRLARNHMRAPLTPSIFVSLADFRICQRGAERSSLQLRKGIPLELSSKVVHVLVVPSNHPVSWGTSHSPMIFWMYFPDSPVGPGGVRQ